MSVDFTDLSQNPEDWRELNLVVCREGVVHALVYWWELDLDVDGAHRIATAPFGRACDSLEQAVCMLTGRDAELRVRQADDLKLHVRLHDDGVECALRRDVEDSSTLLGEGDLIRVNDRGHRALSHLDEHAHVRVFWRQSP